MRDNEARLNGFDDLVSILARGGDASIEQRENTIREVLQMIALGELVQAIEFLMSSRHETLNVAAIVLIARARRVLDGRCNPSYCNDPDKFLETYAGIDIVDFGEK